MCPNLMFVGQLCRKKVEKVHFSFFSLHKKIQKKIYEVKKSLHSIKVLIDFVDHKNRFLPYLGLGYVSVTVC